jgi:hypothetical protein
MPQCFAPRTPPERCRKGLFLSLRNYRRCSSSAALAPAMDDDGAGIGVGQKGFRGCNPFSPTRPTTAQLCRASDARVGLAASSSAPSSSLLLTSTAITRPAYCAARAGGREGGDLGGQLFSIEREGEAGWGCGVRCFQP